MDTSVADPQEIEGLPAGFTVKPISPAAAPVEGLPAGYTVKPIAAPKPPAPVQQPPAAAPAQPGILSRAAQLFGNLIPKERTPGMPGVDLSDIPAPLPKTGPPATYTPSAQEAADLPPQVAKPPIPAAPTATMGASSPGLVERGMNVLRNSPFGHAVQTEFPGAPEWMKPTTRQGTPEYEAEQEQLRPEQLVEGVTQEQANKALKVATLGTAAPLPEGTFRKSASAAATPTESRAVGFAKAAGELASAPSVATQVGIAAATGGLGEILAAPLVPAVAGKVVHALIGAGFTAQMASGVVDDIKQWREAHDKGDEKAANEAMGRMVLSGAMTALAGLGTVHEGHAAVQEHKAALPTKEGVQDYIRQQAETRAKDAATPGNIIKREAGAPAEEKPVLHESNDVEQLRASAERQAPALGDAVKDATAEVPGAKLEAVRDSKDSDRIEAKAERQGVEPSQIGDIAAVKVTVPDQAAADKVLENLNEQMPVESVNGSVNGEPGKNNVRQVQATVDLHAAPGEPVKKAEVLIQTPEMAKAASDSHDDYRKAQELRAAGDEEGAKKIEAEIAAKHDAAEQAARERQGGTDAGGTKEVEPKYKFASTQHNIEEKSEAGQALNATRSKIADADLAGDGKDIDGNHVTVRYGLKHDLTPEMRAFLESQSPFDATLGPTESFKPSESSDGAAPIIAPIESPELERLNKEIEQHGDFEKSDFPDYKPHATVAYVKPEAAAKYTGDKSTAGKKFRVDSISVTDRNGNPTEIPLKGGAERAAPEDKVERVPVDQMALDPKRFQYKMNTDQSGVTNLLKGRKWNEQLAGRINVWRDPADQKLYVVNGHHRFQLARENGVKDVKVDYIQADNAQEARAVGALQNIAEGRGSVMDAAKFFRDSKATPESLDALGVSMGEATAAHGMALARLDPSIFDQVVQGKLRPGRAIAIGNASADPADQEALLKLINKAETKGKRVTDDVVDELARMVKGAGQHTETQTNLFGAQEMTRNLALEKADISSHIREKIGQERRTFQSVADSGKAAQLSAKVAGQKLKPEENAKIAEAAKMAQELYDRHSTRAGTIDDILNRAAKKLAEGGKPSEVRQRAYDDIRAELARSLSGIVEKDSGRVSAPQEKERAAGKAPIPPQRASDTRERGAERTDARVQEPSASAVKPPKPREPLFNEGRQTTPIEVRDADGNWKRGTLDYYNGGVNGQPRRGRVTLEDGTKMNNVPDEAMRMAAGARKIEIPNKDVRPVTHSPGEADVIARTKANAEKLVGDYLEKNTDKEGVPTIATDAAKELFPEFKSDPVNNDRDVAAGAKAVRNWALDHALAEPVDPSRPDVLITTASPGSGKTTGQALVTDSPGLAMKIEAISDSDKGFNQILQQVIDSGRRPVVEWVYVDQPAKTVRRMFRRAIGHDDRPGIGRTVQLAYMADAYHEVPRVIERAIEKFGDKIAVHVIDNSGLPGEATGSRNLEPFLEKIKAKSYNQIKEEMNGEVEQLRSEGLFESERGRDSLKAAYASDEKSGEFEADRPSGQRDHAVPEGGGKAEERPQAAGSLLTPEKQIEQERQANDARASERKAAVQAAADRSLRENAAGHQSKIEDFKGRKAVVLDPDGEAVWHRVFRKIVRGPLGAGEAWRGMQLDRVGVNTAIAYLKGAVEDFKVAGGVVDEKAIDGLNRMAQLLKESRNEQGGSVILRGDYRADTAREEAGHQWQVEHDLQKSDAMTEVAGRPEFTDAVDKLKEMGYKDASARTLAIEAMSKAMAGDLDFPITDAQREDLVRSFLTAAVEEKGPRILDNLPDVDPRVREVVDQIKEQYGEHDGRGAQGGPRQADRAEGREARGNGGKGNAGPRAPDRERRGQRTDAGAREAVPEESASKAELEAAGQGSMFQRKAPRPVRAEDSFALPGMENVDREREAAGGEEQARLMTDTLHSAKGDISDAAGRMERESPLFYGKGENPDLFSQGQQSGLFDVLNPEEKQATLFQRAKPDEDFSKWFRTMADLHQQYHEDTLKPQREAVEAAKREGGSPADVAARMGVRLKEFQDVADANKEVSELGEPAAQMERRAKFEDWARKKGIEIPEMPKQLTLFQKAAGDEEGPIAKSVRDLVDEMRATPKTKGTMLDRVADWSKDAVVESVDRSQKAFNKAPDALEAAWAWSKATTAALIHDYMHPIEQTDWKRSAGQMQLAEAESAQRLLALGREIKKTVPKELDRIAISHFMEAGGDDRKLRTWALGAKELAIKAQNDPMMSRQRKSYLRDAVEHYEAAQKLTPEQKALAGRLRKHFDDMLDIAQKNGIIDYGYRNYVMHMYDREEAARLLNEVDTNELNPNPGFIKKRFYDTLFTAEQSGMTPKSKDIGYLLTAYDKSLNQAVASRNFMRSLMDAKAPDGRPIAVIRSKDGFVTVDGEKGLQVLSQRPRPTSLAGYEFIDRPQLRGFLFKPTTEDLAGYDPRLFEDNPEGLAFKGSLMIHPKYVSQITDMLTPGWFDRGETWPQKIGKGIQTVSGAAKELMTAAAPFHMVQLGIHGIEHKVNPFKLPDIDLSGNGENSRIQRVLASHGLSLVNYDAEGLFGTRALHGIAEHVPFVNKAMDTIQAFSHWQFQDYIPRLKMEMAVDAFKRNTKLYGSKLSEEQIAELTSKESNAAFGNLNTVFDSVPRTKTFKQLLKLATFAPDFLESRIRFVGQAMTRYGGEQRAALARGALAMYVAARIGNALLNNGDAKWDPEHAFSLVVHGKAYALRTVQGDLLHAIDDPRGFIYNRLNPLTTRPAVEFLSGRDQMGREKPAGDQVKDLAKAVLPFGVQKVIQTPDESLLNSILTSAGINARNDRTSTEEEVHRLYLKGIPSSPQDEEQQAEHRKLRKLEDGIRDGSKAPGDVWALVKSGEISPREASRTVERGQQSRLQIEFKGLRLKDAMAVYEKLQKEANHPQIYPHVAMELSELKPEMAYKASHAIADLPEADREVTANKLNALLSAPDPQMSKK